jgi:hypothetical protein
MISEALGAYAVPLPADAAIREMCGSQGTVLVVGASFIKVAMRPILHLTLAGFKHAAWDLSSY